MLDRIVEYLPMATTYIGRDPRDNHVMFEVERDKRSRSWKLWRASGLSQTPGGDGCYQTGRFQNAKAAMETGNWLAGAITPVWTKLPQ